MSQVSIPTISPPSDPARVFEHSRHRVALGTSFLSGVIRWRFDVGRWSGRIGLILSGIYLAMLFLAAVAPHLLVSGDPLAASAREAFHPPGPVHLLGTDENGRDVLTRIVYGVRGSLVMGMGATAIGLLLGISIGVAAGLGPRLVESWFMRLMDVLLAFPDLLLALVIITFWGQGLINAMIAIGVASVPRYARLVRAQSHIVWRSSYVEAARTLGLPPLIIIWRHVLPNVIKPVFVLATIGLGGKIAAGAALSFLGFGTPPPAPEWGAMLSVARNFMANAWWLTAFPSLALVLTVIALSAVGRYLVENREGKASH